MEEKNIVDNNNPKLVKNFLDEFYKLNKGHVPEDVLRKTINHIGLTSRFPGQGLNNTMAQDLLSKHGQLIKNRNLPEMYLPKNKIDLLIDWYNKDLRLEGIIPQAFKEGYLTIENDLLTSLDKDYIRELIKDGMKTGNKTFLEVKEVINYLIDYSDKITLYFKFITENEINVKVYLSNTIQISYADIGIGKDKDNPLDNEVNLDLIGYAHWDDLFKEFCRILFCLLASTLWYLSTSSNPTKYIYENKSEVNEKVIRKPHKEKKVRNPIYDLSKIREKKIDGLIKKRKGWTYSHSFEVHGHYRHYKSGKVIFVKPFIKGKEKEFIQQKIIIDPKK